MNSIESQSIDRSMPTTSPSPFEHFLRITSLSQLLRFVGACAVVASMSLFMLKGWSEGNDISRYLKLLAQTGLLTGVGLMLTFLVKEVKGARVFFGLSLFSVAANFTILGALTYSMVQWDGSLITYPSMMRWEVVNPLLFLPVFCGALVALTLVAYFSFNIFARRIAGPLTFGFLVLSSVLLVPVRSSVFVCLLAGVSVVAAALLVKRLRQTEHLALTIETKASLAILFLPAVIILIRALSLYHVDTVMMTCLSGLAYLALHAWTSTFERASMFRRLVRQSQVLVGLLLAYCVVDLLPLGNSAWAFTGFACVSYALLADQLQRSSDNGWNAWNLNIVGFLLPFGTLWIALIDGALAWQLSALIVAATSLFVCWLSRDRVTNNQVATLSGKLAGAGSVILLGSKLIQIADLSNWMLIGIAGITLILGASLYERYGLRLSAHTEP